jgi:hypothetical protein
MRSQRLATVRKAMYGGLKKILYATGAKTSRSARPIWFFDTKYYEDTIPFGGGGVCIFISVWWLWGTDGLAMGHMCWSRRRKAGKHR